MKTRSRKLVINCNSYYGLIYILASVLLSCAVLVSSIANIPIELFTRDIATVAEIHPLNGVISNVGILLWCASVSICLFSYTILEKVNHKHTANSKKKIDFLLHSGLITLMLMLDDFFLLHEYILPSLYIREEFVICSYIVIIISYVVKFRKIIVETEWIVLFSSFLFFAISIISDMLTSGNELILVEDGLKLFGIASWFGYFARLCFKTCNDNNIKINSTLESKI